MRSSFRSELVHRLLVVLLAVLGSLVLVQTAGAEMGRALPVEAGAHVYDATATSAISRSLAAENPDPDSAGPHDSGGKGPSARHLGRLADLVAPRTTPGTAIEPMWAQAPSRGFLGGWSRADTLKPGTVIDRYGGETGRFFSPQGTPLDARALPTGSGPLNTYEVLKPLDVQGGIVAPAFGQPGLGVQYMTDFPVADLIEQGFLKPLG